MVEGGREREVNLHAAPTVVWQTTDSHERSGTQGIKEILVEVQTELVRA